MAAKQKSVTRIIQDARALIADPAHWIRGTNAKTSQRGAVVSPDSAEATCFCAEGALIRAGGESINRLRASRALRDALRGDTVGAIGFERRHLISYNDREGSKAKIHGEVIALFDAAIKKSKSRKKVSA